MNEIIVTPLGTVSPYPKNGRNCPAFLIEYKNNKILLDCGNGITSMLNLPSDLNNLSIIISHLHPDHYGDLLCIAQATYVFKKLGYINKRIKVYIPQGDKAIYKEIYTESGIGGSRTIKKNLIDYDYLLSLKNNSYLEFIPYNVDNKLIYDDLTISFSKNPHQLITYSIKLETAELSLVYSSDTGYKNNSLEEFARNTNLLICESTFLRGQIKKDDTHLYAYEAGKIAQIAQVNKLLLTHFWPEIDKNLYLKEAKQEFNNTQVAEEGVKLILRRDNIEK